MYMCVFISLWVLETESDAASLLNYSIIKQTDMSPNF